LAAVKRSFSAGRLAGRAPTMWRYDVMTESNIQSKGPSGPRVYSVYPLFFLAFAPFGVNHIHRFLDDFFYRMSLFEFFHSKPLARTRRLLAA
jgi:hypothetical protein